MSKLDSCRRTRINTFMHVATKCVCVLCARVRRTTYEYVAASCATRALSIESSCCYFNFYYLGAKQWGDENLSDAAIEIMTTAASSEQ